MDRIKLNGKGDNSLSDKNRVSKRALVFLISFLFIQSTALSIESERRCEITSTEEPPFWVVKGDKSMKSKEYENFKDIDEKKNKKNIAYIPKRSIVARDTDRPSIYYDFNKKKSEYMPVVVVSTPKDFDKEKTDIATHLNPLLKVKKAFSPGSHSGKDRVTVGQIGYIYNGYTESNESEGIRHNSSLQRADNEENRYVVKKNSPLFNIKGVEKFDQDHSLTLAKSGKGFKIEKCVSILDSEDVKINYIFNVSKINDKGTYDAVGDIKFNLDEGCSLDLLSSLLPVPEKSYEYLLGLSKAISTVDNEEKGIEDVIYIDGHELARLPQEKIEKIDKQCYTKGPYGSYHYIGSRIWNCKKKSSKRESISDSLMNPKVSCSFSNALRKIQKRCPKCQVEWGDAFWPKGRHQSHDTGVCVDIRPIKKDDALGPMNISWRSRYDSDSTKIVIEELSRSGANQILYNDSKALRAIDKTTRGKTAFIQDKKIDGDDRPIKLHKRPHSNHIHVCYPAIPYLETEKNQLKLDRLQAKRYKNKWHKDEIRHLKRMIPLSKRMKESCNELSLSK
jgi:hypothetical protein